MYSHQPCRLAFPAYRVFIYGLEVSSDVLSVNVTYNSGAIPNSCQITLSNELDKYMVTTDDIIYINSSKLRGKQIKIPWITPDMDPVSMDATSNSDITSGTLHPNKLRILLSKGIIDQDVPKELRQDPFGMPLSSSHLNDYFGEKIKKYPIADGTSIFHSMDPVRVFFRDPFDPTSWYHMFCGFVSDIVDDTNENHVKTLSVLVEDPTKLFRYTRTVINPGILDARKMVADNDVAIQSFWTNPFADMTLLDIFYMVIFGPERGIDVEKFSQAADSANGKSDLATRLRGIGHFSFDRSVVATVGPGADTDRDEQIRRYGSSDYNDGGLNNVTDEDGIRIGISTDKAPIHLGTNLAIWQMLLDHKVSPSDMCTMATDNDVTNKQEMANRKNNVSVGGQVDIDRVINYIGSRPDLYPVDGGRLMVLIPRSLGAHNNQLILKDLIQSYPLTSDFTSAGQLLYEVIDRIQFCMYCSPRGDIVVEPPLHDFNPDDFGMQPIKEDETADDVSYAITQAEFNRALRLFGGTGERGPYGPNYVILKRDTYGWNAAQIDDKVYTMAAAKHALFKNWDQLGYSEIIGDLSVVKIPELIPLYGVRQAPITPRGYISTREAAMLYANICLNRLNADAHTMRVSHVPNIKLWLNRPIYVQGRNLLATTKQVSHSITWGASGDMQTNTDLYAVRTWTGNVDINDNMIYTTIGGCKLFDYATLFRMAPRAVGSESGDYTIQSLPVV